MHNKTIIYSAGDKIGNCIYVQEEAGRISGGKLRRRAKFICYCGKEFIATLNSVKYKSITSCGCYKSQRIKEIKTKHGKRDVPEYDVWCHLRSRCRNEKDSQYHNYGGRGIKVCDEWYDSFERFYNDMGQRPSSDHSLDRFPDKNGNYEPSNCRWATQKQQMNNYRGNVLIEYNGEVKTIMEWSESIGIEYSCLYWRIVTNKWAIDKAFTKPSQRIR